MRKIVQKDDSILRQKAAPVPVSMFGKAELKSILKDMKSALSKEDDGVALAAPQVGVPLRLFIVSGKVLELIGEKPRGKKKEKFLVFINPEIVKLSQDREMMEEGCLSARYLYGKIERAKKARLVAYDEKGRKFEMAGAGLLAQIFQHETDHLDGRLFLDSAVDVRDLPPKDPSK